MQKHFLCDKSHLAETHSRCSQSTVSKIWAIATTQQKHIRSDVKILLKLLKILLPRPPDLMVATSATTIAHLGCI